MVVLFACECVPPRRAKKPPPTHTHTQLSTPLKSKVPLLVEAYRALLATDLANISLVFAVIFASSCSYLGSMTRTCWWWSYQRHSCCGLCRQYTVKHLQMAERAWRGWKGVIASRRSVGCLPAAVVVKLLESGSKFSKQTSRKSSTVKIFLAIYNTSYNPFYFHSEVEGQ